MRYADPLAQAEIDRLRAGIFNLEQGYRNEIDRLRACSDPTPPAEGERHTAEQLWHHLLEASSHRRLYVLNQFLEAQDEANRCFLMNHEARLKVADDLGPTCVSCGRWLVRHPWMWCKKPSQHSCPCPPCVGERRGQPQS